MKNKHFYQIFKLKISPWIKYWLIKQTEFKGVLSDILEDISFYLTDSLNMKFKIFDIIGRTTQKSTTGDNLISSENINVKVAGVTYKSQEDGTILANGEKYVGSYSNFTNNTVTLETDTYSSKIFLLDGTIKKDGNDYKPEIYLINQDDNTKSYNIGEIGNSGKTRNIEAGTYFIRIALWNDNVVFTNAKIGLMLVKGSTIPTEFERYTGGEPAPNPNYPIAIKNTGDNGSVNEKVSNSDGTQEQNISFPLAQGQKLMEGDYLADDGVHHKMREVVINGSESGWRKYNDNEYYTTTVLQDAKKGTSAIYGYCDKLKREANGQIEYSYLSKSNNNLGLDIKQVSTYWGFTGSTVEELKQWLSENPFRIQYELAEEQTEDFTEEQKTAWEQIKALRTYKNVTHISSEDETPAELKIQYWKEV